MLFHIAASYASFDIDNNIQSSVELFCNREEGTDDESEYNNKIFRVLIGIVMLIGIGLLTFMKPFLSVYVGKEYYSAWKYTPFLQSDA